MNFPQDCFGNQMLFSAGLQIAKMLASDSVPAGSHFCFQLNKLLFNTNVQCQLTDNRHNSFLEYFGLTNFAYHQTHKM